MTKGMTVFNDLVKVLYLSGMEATSENAEDFMGNIPQMDVRTLQALIVACTQELVDRAA